jgi:amino acid adenylation domain-containing protein
MTEPTITLVPTGFEQQAARSPQRPALVSGDVRLSYAELEERSRRVARAVLERGATADAPVAVVMHRGAAQLIAILGVLRAGAAYVCVDAAQPERRIQALLGDCAADLLISDQPWPGFAGHVLHPDDLPETAVPLRVPVSAGDLAYILYTSGSSGTPKGVAVTHRALANYCASIVDLLGCAGYPRSFASVTSLSTDLGNTAVFPALVSGGCVHLVPDRIVRDPAEFAGYLRDHRVDYLKTTPSHLAALLEYPDTGMLPRRALLLGGEALRWELVDEIRARGACRVINHYGPTEATVGSLIHELGAPPDQYRSLPTVPIGRPIAGVGARIVDAGLDPVPDGTPGELLLSGAGLAREYWGDRRLTAERFVTGADGVRCYRTGDRARRLDGEVVEFLGRLDSQVKIRGHRVEPAEVEAALLSHPQVRQAAVVADAVDATGELGLIGFVVVTDAPAPTSRMLRDHVETVLPPPMVPSTVHVVEALPLTAGGKLDRRALLAG